MTDTSKRTLVAIATIGSVVMTLLVSGLPSQARKAYNPRVIYHEGINANGTVVCDGQVVGRDPDRNIQMQLLWECGRTNGDGGGDE